ncbi:uncharacterized protein TM35_000033310 [Trypanosoma theileri]|uniref:Uncharacterized protein n=1 Tax=Trypanosoma theileri TaxID=67003 RepID=A0A1X0P6T9_9TRYP|nr:uncharacterized protein TM35_000033310 [Trypanosoma theileri]ORC92578.1 hypothetical protein TM35_000033310 [Trypanosoma theileri]
MVVTQIGVRTANDKEEEAREKALMEAIAKENENPFQQAAQAIFGLAGNLYTNYLYTSGTLLLLWTWWGLYPSYARFRHKHIMRFRRRRQGEVRRALFYTRHIPKWDKKYLQRIELPEWSRERIPAMPKSFLKMDTSLHSSSLTPVQNNAVSASELSSAIAHESGNNDFTPLVTARTSAAATFAGAACAKSEGIVMAGVDAINESLPHDAADVDVHALQQQVRALLQHAHTTVVLRETHATRLSVPLGREVWWVAADEARRRREWWFWMQILIVARVLQDLLEMPEMPDLVQ